MRRARNVCSSPFKIIQIFTGSWNLEKILQISKETEDCLKSFDNWTVEQEVDPGCLTAGNWPSETNSSTLMSHGIKNDEEYTLGKPWLIVKWDETQTVHINASS